MNIDQHLKGIFDKHPAGVSTAEAMSVVAQVCQITADQLRNDGLPPGSFFTKAKKPGLSPLHSYINVVQVNGVDYTIDIRPKVSEFDSCAAAEQHYGRTLVWEEKADRHEGKHPDFNVRLAVVKKK